MGQYLYQQLEGMEVVEMGCLACLVCPDLLVHRVRWAIIMIQTLAALKCPQVTHAPLP